MKRMKRLATILLTLCLVVPCIPFVAHAANGQIMFTDPAAKTGEDVTVTGVVKTGGPDIGDANVTMTYDTTALQFVSGDNVTAGTDGTLVYDGKSSGGSTEHRYNMVFKVLKEGTTKIEVSAYKAYLASDETLNCDKGSATVTAEKGTEPVANTTTTTDTTTPASGEKVTVNDKEYTLSQTFEDKDIPAGYKAAEVTYNGAAVKMVHQEESGVYLGYLVDSSNKGDFFLYNEDDATFSPFEQVMISDTTTIVLLSDTKALKLPSDYKSVTFSIQDSGNDFPAWQNTKTDGFYIVYAINNEGTKGFYQYDKNEGTYQRFEMPTVSSEKKSSSSMLGKVEDFMGNHLSYFILGAGLGLLLLLIIVIVIGVKLHNRNAELDELYEEYDIDGDSEPEVPVKRRAAPIAIPLEEEEEPVKEKKSIFASRKDKEDEEFFNDDDFADEDDSEDDYANDYEDDDDFDDDEDDDDYEVFETSRALYNDEDDDDFKVDFIDLDD